MKKLIHSFMAVALAAGMGYVMPAHAWYRGGGFYYPGPGPGAGAGAVAGAFAAGAFAGIAGRALSGGDLNLLGPGFAAGPSGVGVDYVYGNYRVNGVGYFRGSPGVACRRVVNINGTVQSFFCFSGGRWLGVAETDFVLRPVPRVITNAPPAPVYRVPAPVVRTSPPPAVLPLPPPAVGVTR